jgi:hypothetical protein
MTPRKIKIWIVEDQKGDALTACDAIERVAQAEGPFQVFWDQTMRWDADVTEPPIPDGQLRPGEVQSDPVQFSKLNHMPDIVILDLLDEHGKFVAARFYGDLRKEERDSELPASFVIAWSVKTGLPEVNKFREKSEVDRRLKFTGTKSDRSLEESVRRCVVAWREAQLL